MTEGSNAQSNKLALEDLSLGQTFRSGSFTVDTQRIKDFCRDYDPQPFHQDEDAAKNSFFGELVASGWLTASVTMRLVVESIPIAGGLVGAKADVSWTKPTRPGDALRVESEVLDIKSSPKRPERGIVTMRSTTFNQADETVQTMVCKLVVPSRQSLTAKG